jgi:hypothetical protein
MTILKSHHQRPFSGGWSDWFAPEESVVLTLQTMRHHLYETWKDHCIYTLDRDHEGGIERVGDNRIVDHSEFRADELLSPGIHQEIHLDDPELAKEVYDIIVPDDFLHQEICRGWINRLNSEYNREFELVYSLDESVEE